MKMILGRRHKVPAVLVALSLAPWAAMAQSSAMPSPQNVMSLSATASVDVVPDVLNVDFATTRDGAEAAAVQAQLVQALDTALAESRKVAAPGQLEVNTGNFALYPRQLPNGGALQWQGRAELQVKGSDIKAITQLVSRMQTLSVARVYYSLSREAREKVDGEVNAMAIKEFRDKALRYARDFGFSTVTLREVQLGGDGGAVHPVMRMNAAGPMAARSAEALPVEAGKMTLSATVNGSVQMK